jgi:hypothetical protein
VGYIINEWRSLVRFFFFFFFLVLTYPKKIPTFHIFKKHMLIMEIELKIYICVSLLKIELEEFFQPNS